MAAGGGQREQPDGAGPAKAGGTGNVVRFPGNWFGSKDDLVPFGPSAERIGAEREAKAAAEPQNATDFWGGGSGVLPPPAGIDAEPPSPAAWSPEAEAGVEAQPVPVPDLPVLPDRLTVSDHRGVEFQRRRRSRRRSLEGLSAWIARPSMDLTIFSAGLALVMVIGACVAFAFSHTGGSAKAKPTASTNAGTARHRPASSSGDRSRPAGSISHHSASPSGLKAIMTRHHEGAAAHQRVKPHRRPARSAPTGAGTTGATGSGAGSTGAGSTGAATDVASSNEGSAPTTSDGGDSSATGADGAAKSSTPSTNSSTGTAHSSTGGTTKGPSGPVSPGGTVGGDCNPVCQ